LTNSRDKATGKPKKIRILSIGTGVPENNLKQDDDPTKWDRLNFIKNLMG